MATAVRWKFKPLLALVVVALFTLLAIVQIYSIHMPSSLSHAADTKNDFQKPVHSEDIVWPEINKGTNEGDPGEKGIAVQITQEETIKMNKAYSEYGFNQYVSDKISLHRSIPDPRPKSCAWKKYPSIMPKVSVIIIFHNEGWSTLLRTVHSVLNRSPKELLHEIVLCDDFSVKSHLKEELERYVLAYPKVKLVRTTQREGLIRARVYGADHATGDILLFLDSHCEANVGWLPPLVAEINRDYRTVVCPTVDFIDHKDFHYRGVDPYIRGTFNWRFDYKERAINAQQKKERKDETEGVKSPVMAGGLFAISKKFWEELGKYDPGMYVWGGEQYEISFKLWMCGGKMLNMPCSRVGHVYRRNVPYTYDRPNAVLINFKRVAEVWMDEFKSFLYHHRPDIKYQKHGDIADRVDIKERNQCKSFKWYLKNVANDTIRTRYEPDRAFGQVKHEASGLCLDTLGRATGGTLTLSPCHSHRGQNFHWTYLKEMRQDPEECIDARYTDLQNIFIEKCHLMGGNQKFEYDQILWNCSDHTLTNVTFSREKGTSQDVDVKNQSTKQLHHAGTSKCVSASHDDNKPAHPIVEVCDVLSKHQKWEMQVEDPNKPIPDWARIAEDLEHYPIP